MSAIPTFREIWLKAKRERREIVATVLMANDAVLRIKFGPRGGHYPA
jgi:hypothetical protein